ncbi:MAG TPA: RagB/SusD family nutrient uptake outer membrane protein [Chitinophaga sp.]|uniref:RagB/SusD family nutrient uptake outer membrane protein n=1 Tax=Chitinophaga sp. TaxID=1869181 RepID=UPI002CF87A80|nr:RagB/SusD family nutrient uptake outer membrane protein [Chitinophaga sp.]HVI46499.1 RagB/SusD family nutrient uptake outer membrane protein [Chitinophaga sp.]
MMKHNIKVNIFILAGSLFLAACNKYLEVDPDNRTTLDSPEKIAQMLTSAYPDQDYICFSESMSDNAGDRGHSGDQYSGDLRVNINAYRFVDYASTAGGSPDVYWQGCYKAIAAANQALDAIDKAGAPAAYAPYKGEGLVARAYAHFMLVTFFAKPYDSVTSASDPGIPYVLKPETTLNPKYERKTVKYVYDMIEKDLTDGLPLISNSAYKVPSFHFNKAAVTAFAARFYLFKKDYAKATMYASQAFPGGNFKDYLRPLNTTMNTATRSERNAAFTSPDTKANLLLATANSIWARAWLGYQFGLNRVISLGVFFSGNVSGGSCAYNVFYYGSNNNDQGIEKWKENFVYTSADIGNPYIYVPLFTAEEVLFNHAEASARLTKLDDAIADLNTYYRTRVVSYDPAKHAVTLDKVTNFYKMTADPQGAVIKAILDARRAEFMQEGMRWMDMLRNKLPVTHKENDGTSLTIGADDPRRQLQIPQAAQAYGLPANPR